jgi:hypothetical protein
MEGRGLGDTGPDVRINVLGGLARGAVDVIAALDKLLPEASPTKHPVIKQVAFRDVICYFQEEQPNDFGIAAGALLRRRAANGVVLYQIFLDDTDSIVTDERGRPFGRAVRAREIDDELNHRFGRTDLIIFR